MPDPVAGTSATAATAATVSPEAAMAAIAAHRADLRELDRETDKSGRERHILDKSFKLRRKIAQQDIEIAQLKAAQPKDGTVALSKEDAAEYEAFKKLNAKPADLAAAITERDALKAKQADQDAAALFAEAADALGLANHPLFVRTMTREGLHLEFKDVQVRDEESGKLVTVKVPMVRPKADDKAQLVPLEDYLGEELGPEFIAALQSEPPREGEEGDDEEEPATAGRERRDESFARTAARMGDGDPSARRTAASAAARSRSSGGVAIPVTRHARPSTGASRQARSDREAIEEKARNPIYAGL